jgi:hypothetical protein
MRCERTQARPDPAISAYRHPSSGGAGNRNLRPAGSCDVPAAGDVVLLGIQAKAIM